MNYNPNIHHHRSIRLQGYNYSQTGLYYIKIRVKKNRRSPKQICEELINQNRANYIAPADYREDSDLDKVIKLVINKEPQVSEKTI